MTLPHGTPRSNHGYKNGGLELANGADRNTDGHHGSQYTRAARTAVVIGTRLGIPENGEAV